MAESSPAGIHSAVLEVRGGKTRKTLVKKKGERKKKPILVSHRGRELGRGEKISGGENRISTGRWENTRPGGNYPFTLHSGMKTNRLKGIDREQESRVIKRSLRGAGQKEKHTARTSGERGQWKGAKEAKKIRGDRAP